jgi:hypothetical protein
MKELTITLLLVYIIINQWNKSLYDETLVDGIEMVQIQNKLIMLKIDVLRNQAALDSIDNNLNK